MAGSTNSSGHGYLARLSLRLWLAGWLWLWLTLALDGSGWLELCMAQLRLAGSGWLWLALALLALARKSSDLIAGMACPQ